MNVLITGGAGFIGSHLTWRLIKEGHSVTVLDNLSTGLRENLPADVDFIACDLAESDFLDSIPMRRYDAVCHLAAQSSGAVSAEDPAYDLRVNGLSTVMLARWCLNKKVPRFLYASSMAVYGDPATLPVNEACPGLPLSQYGVSKLSSEHSLRLAAKEGLRTTSFRMFNVYGPGQNLKNLKQGMVSIYLAYLLAGKTLTVTGSLERIRDFIYVDDVVDCWYRALLHNGSLNLVYNLGSGQGTTVRVLIAELLRTMDLPTSYDVIATPALVGDQFALWADITAISRDLSFRPQTALAEGLARMVGWARAGAVAVGAI